MEINVLSFGIVREILGNKWVSLEVPDTITVDGLKVFLENKYPRLKTLASYMIAVNDEYASGDCIIKQNDEVAVIPPVSGG